MAANNQGIYHLAAVRGGQPFCRNRKAHMSTTAEHAIDEQLRVCTKCLSRIKESEQGKFRAPDPRKATLPPSA